MAGAGEIAILAAVLVGLVVTYLLQKRNLLSRPANAKEPPLKVEALYFYPIKGLRGCAIKAGKIGPLGFQDDRCFCLQKVHRDPATKDIQRYESLYSGFNLELVLFSTLVEDADDSGERHLVITWTGPENTHVQPGQQVPWTTKQEDDGNDGNDGNDSNDSIATTEFQLRVPLRPKGVAGLRAVPVDMHGATTPAYDMGDAAAAWFARRLGFEARLAYLGPRNSRPVLGSGAPGSDLAARRRLSPLAYHLRRWLVPAGLRGRPERISFCDIAQFLVVTAESNAEVTRRLREDVDGDPDVDPDASAAAAAGPGPEEGVEMDVTKFRPNIVLSGSPAAFDEDYWAELEFRSGSTSSSSSSSGVRMAVTLNCWRCQSIVVDYATGKPATGASGLAWKKLSRDRRVDKGWKYNPVFGRYGFCAAADAGREIRLGDEVRVTRRAEEVSVFDWPMSKAALSAYGSG